MKFLFIGLGSIATKHIKDLVEICKIRTIKCEITVLRREIKELPAELDSLIIKQITVLDSTRYDVSFITNPTYLHYSTLELLKGKCDYYFIEKPIFDNCAYDYFQLGINESNAYVACPIRHTGTYKKLKEICTMNRVYNSRIICSSYLPDWRNNVDYRQVYSARKDLGGGVALDLIHEIDYMTGLFGLPEKVFNVHGKYSDLEIDAEDLSVYIAQYRHLLCEIHLDYFGREYRRTCEVFTHEGSYIADFKRNVIIMPGKSEIDCADKGKTSLYTEMEYFLDLISDNTVDNINSPQHGFEVLKITLGE